MKRLLLVLTIGCTVSLFAGAATAWADAGPHKMTGGLVTTPTTCAACHRAHTGQAPYLLKEKQEALCFTCHGSTASGSSLDASDGVGYPEGMSGEGKETVGEGRSGKVAALRGGGFKYAMIKSETVEKELGPEGSHGLPTVQATIPTIAEGELRPSTSAHSVNESSQIAWGNGAIDAASIKEGSTETAAYGAKINLTCGSCHDPHGNGNYRILRPIPTESGAKTEVKIPEEEGKHEYTTTNYWKSWSATDPGFYEKISEWCALCHTRIMASDEAGTSATTSSGDAVFTYRHRTSYTVAEYEKVEKEGSPTKGAALGATAMGAKPNCIQCHVAHGSDATMAEYAGGVKFPNGSTESETNTVVTKAEDSFLLRLNNRGVCQTCHNK